MEFTDLVFSRKQLATKYISCSVYDNGEDWVEESYMAKKGRHSRISFKILSHPADKAFRILEDSLLLVAVTRSRSIEEQMLSKWRVAAV